MPGPAPGGEWRWRGACHALDCIEDADEPPRDQAPGAGIAGPGRPLPVRAALRRANALAGATPMADYTPKGKAYLPAGSLAEWGQGIAEVARVLGH